MSHYEAYFLGHQRGGNIGQLYRTPLYIQKGRGLGNLFRGVQRLYGVIAPYLKPYLRKAGIALGGETQRLASQVLQNFGTEPIGKILRKEGKKSLMNLTEKAENKLKELRSGLQQGSGRRKPLIKHDLALTSHIPGLDSHQIRPMKRVSKKSKNIKKRKVKSGKKRVKKRKTSKRKRAVKAKVFKSRPRKKSGKVTKKRGASLEKKQFLKQLFKA